MTSPERSSLLKLYQHVIYRSVLQCPEADQGRKSKRGIYSPAVVLWLMMLQRLQGAWNVGQWSSAPVARGGETAPEPVPASAPETDFLPYRRLLPGPSETVEEMAETSEPGNCRTIAKVLQLAGEVPVFVVDGSTLELEQSRSLARQYPLPKTNMVEATGRACAWW